MTQNLNFRIFHSSNNKKSLMVRDQEIWISKRLIDNAYSFEKEVYAASPIKFAIAIKLSRIRFYRLNHADNRLTISYLDIHQKKKENRFVFSPEREFNIVADQLNNKLSFMGKKEKERLITPLLKFGTPIVLLLVFTIFIYMAGPLDDFQSSGRRSFLQDIIKTLYNLVGTTGIIILGLIPVFVLGYLLSKRILNPEIETVYQ